MRLKGVDMEDHSDKGLSRRTALQTGAVAATSLFAAGMSRPALPSATTRPSDPDALPTTPLGKTGVELTRLTLGASFPDYGPRLLRFAYGNGIRGFDNSYRYVGGKSEAILGDFVNRSGKRDTIFVVTKTHASTPEKFYDAAVAALDKLELDTIDLFMMHGIDDPARPLDRKGKWRKVKDRLVRENKIRFMGFSTHAEMPKRIACLENATRGGWVDAILCAADPGLIRSNAEFNKALDTCATAGVGLIAMKASRGLGKAIREAGKSASKPAEPIRNPFAPLGLSPHHAMYAGLWSDGRFSSVCTEMMNRREIEENARFSRTFDKPFDESQWKLFDEGAKRTARATCPGCDGSCRDAAGTKTDFCSIARYLAYMDEDGKREDARRLFAALTPGQRDWEEADLAAASRACRGGLDLQAIIDRAKRFLA